jgi:hypothetical protein
MTAPAPQQIQVPAGLFCVTTYGSVTQQTTQAIWDLRDHSTKTGLQNVAWMMVPSALVEKARNDAVRTMQRRVRPARRSGSASVMPTWSHPLMHSPESWGPPMARTRGRTSSAATVTSAGKSPSPLSTPVPAPGSHTTQGGVLSRLYGLVPPSCCANATSLTEFRRRGFGYECRHGRSISWLRSITGPASK